MVAGLAAALAAVSAARAAAPESRVHVFLRKVVSFADADVDLHRVRIDPPTGMLSGMLLGKIRGGIETTVTERLTTAKSIAEKE
jgi:hypothetical protein